MELVYRLFLIQYRVIANEFAMFLCKFILPTMELSVTGRTDTNHIAPDIRAIL